METCIPFVVLMIFQYLKIYEMYKSAKKSSNWVQSENVLYFQSKQNKVLYIMLVLSKLGILILCTAFRCDRMISWWRHRCSSKSSVLQHISVWECDRTANNVFHIRHNLLLGLNEHCCMSTPLVIFTAVTTNSMVIVGSPVLLLVILQCSGQCPVWPSE